MLSRGVGALLWISLTACTVAGPAPMPPAGDWLLVALADDQSVPVDPPLTASFSTDAVQGSAGCNRYRGGWRLTDAGGLAIGPLATTKRACRGPVMAREQAFLARLQAVEDYRLENGMLLMVYNTSEVRGTLRFRPR